MAPGWVWSTADGPLPIVDAGDGRHDAPAARAPFASLMSRKLTDIVDLCAAPPPSCRRRPASTAGHRRYMFDGESPHLVCSANHAPLLKRERESRTLVCA